MKQPGFFRGVMLAAVLALVGAIGYAGLSTIIGGALAIRLLTVVLGGSYILYLLSGAGDRTGRIAVFAGWIVSTAALWFASADLSLSLITQTLLISLTRGLHYHASALTALLDLGLSAFALSTAIWASTQSGSLFLTIWCFFLVQALFVSLPTKLRNASPREATNQIDDQFSRALGTAETALRRIANKRTN